MIKTLLAAALAVAAVGLAGPAAAAPPDLCDPQSVDADGMCQFHASGVFDDIDLVFPSDYPEQQKVEDYLHTVVEGYQHDGGPDMPTSPHALEVTGTRFHAPGTQSVVLDVYQNVGGAHPSEWYKAFNYSTATSAPISFDTLFRPGVLQQVLPLVQQDLSRQFGQPVTIPTDTGLDPANYQNFALTDDAVIFFFDRTALLPATPATQVSVPRSAIAGHLNG